MPERPESDGYPGHFELKWIFKLKGLSSFLLDPGTLLVAVTRVQYGLIIVLSDDAFDWTPNDVSTKHEWILKYPQLVALHEYGTSNGLCYSWRASFFPPSSRSLSIRASHLSWPLKFRLTYILSLSKGVLFCSFDRNMW